MPPPTRPSGDFDMDFMGCAIATGMSVVVIIVFIIAVLIGG